jgi:hypothetical protein
VTSGTRHALSLALCAIVGLALWMLYPDSYQQDGGHHYLAARWAWVYPEALVGVWNRPLFTFLYSFPAQWGYPAAKLLTLAIALLTAHHTYRLATALGVDRAWFVVALLFLQPSFLLIATDTMTEPLFALIFVLALRLHVAGRVVVGMAVASLLVAVRPEGFFLALLWAMWVAGESRPGARIRTLATLPVLGVGGALWWLAALAISGDPLYIVNHWPVQWGLDATYGRGYPWVYLARLPEMTGPLLVVPFAVGLRRAVERRRFGAVTSAVVMLFVVHTLLRVSGWFGSAGYPRYFVCVAPAIAILTLVGWRHLAEWWPEGRWRVAFGRLVLACSTVVALLYVDVAGFYGRDAHAVAEMHAWFEQHPQPVTRLVWSQAYMNIVFDRDPHERPLLGGDRDANLQSLRESPPGTLVFWDADTGPSWHRLTATDIASAGYELLHARSFQLDGYLRVGRWLAPRNVRQQQMFLLYKPGG